MVELEERIEVAVRKEQIERGRNALDGVADATHVVILLEFVCIRGLILVVEVVTEDLNDVTACGKEWSEEVECHNRTLVRRELGALAVFNGNYGLAGVCDKLVIASDPNFIARLETRALAVLVFLALARGSFNNGSEGSPTLEVAV